VTGPAERDAGDFGSWLASFRASLRDGDSVDVPCHGCTACCRSGKLIPVEDDEVDALAHLPADCLVPMPGQPAGRFLRHDESGRCSQLTAEGCSVYAHRPQACRSYDCRIFAAAGLRADAPLIAEQAARWRFSYASSISREHHAAVRVAAITLGFPGGLTSPISPTQHALQAIESADQISAPLGKDSPATDRHVPPADA
jgi:Fe-S-cluster containining protein